MRVWWSGRHLRRRCLSSRQSVRLAGSAGPQVGGFVETAGETKNDDIVVAFCRLPALVCLDFRAVRVGRWLAYRVAVGGGGMGRPIRWGWRSSLGGGGGFGRLPSLERRRCLLTVVGNRFGEPVAGFAYLLIPAGLSPGGGLRAGGRTRWSAPLARRWLLRIPCLSDPPGIPGASRADRCPP